MVSVFKDLFNSKDVPYIVSIDKIVARIKTGKSKHLIDEIRKGNKDLKTKLPCIIFAGEFTERNSNSLKKHSGLMVVDFDKYPSTDAMLEHLELLKQNKHFQLLFISPSGNGIKGVVKIPPSDKESHPKYFKSFYKTFNYDYFDISNSNVDRVCFESYDPNIYVNDKAEVFDTQLKEEGFDVSEKVPLIPINNEEVIIDMIMQWDWKKDFVDGERNSFIFDLAGAFCEFGISQTTAIGYIDNNVVIGNFPKREMETTIKSAYKLRSFNSKFFEDYTKIDNIKRDLKKGKDKVIKKYNIEEDVFDEIKEALEHDDFWSINDKNKISINPFKYKFFLERNGFKKHFPNDAEKPSFVYIESNKVEMSSVSKIKDFVLKYLEDKKEIEVWNYCASFQNLFTESYLLMLETIDLIMLSDEKHKSFIAFNNGILEITKDNIELIDYIDVDGYIWKSHILDRDFIYTDNINNDYKQFIFNISSEKPEAIETAIGYLLHTYKNRSNNKAIILNDEIISDNPEGGTGKGLFVQGLNHIRKTTTLDGKMFDDKKSFNYQTVSLDTKILVFDDVKKNFDFESKFSLITEGITLERKNKDAIKLNIHESPKIVLSTNYAIKGEGNSHDRRRHELEIAQYYNSKLTPEDEFKRQLFDDWDDDDFLHFDNYMVTCIQTYFNIGLIQQNAKNIKMRKFIAETSMEFNEWISDINNVPLNVRNDKVEYFELFINEYKDYQKWLTRKRLNIWIKKYCSFKGYEFEDGNSNGSRWFAIKTDNKELDGLDF